MVLSRCLLLILLFYLLFLGLTVAGQEISELVHLREEEASVNEGSTVLSWSEADLVPLSSSVVITAESWLRAHVLSFYRSNRRRDVLRKRSHERQWDSVLLSIRNLYHSLVRWGVAGKMKVAEAFSSACLRRSSQNNLKHLLSFVVPETSSTYAIDKPYRASVHYKTPRWRKKLSFFSTFSSLGRTRPETLQAPFHLARKPRPPSSGFSPLPDASVSFPPDASRVLLPPARPPDVLAVSSSPVSLAPTSGEGRNAGLWCTAKSTVPTEKLQEAMDSACEEGGAGCKEIEPGGSFDDAAVLANSDLIGFLQYHYEIS